MAALTICSDFGAQENKVSLFSLFPHASMKMQKDMTPDHQYPKPIMRILFLLSQLPQWLGVAM